MRFKVAFSVAFVPLIFGCSQLEGKPAAEPFEVGSIGKVKSAKHWDAIAEDVAKQALGLKSNPAFKDRLLFITPDKSSDFARGFNEMLISQLVNSGIPVATQLDQHTLNVTYQTQVVKHRESSAAKRPVPGALTALTGGILVAREIATSDSSLDSRAWMAGALLAGVDLLTAQARLRSPTNTEIIVTTSIADSNRYIMRKTDVYYVEDPDGSLFEGAMKTKSIGVVGQ